MSPSKKNNLIRIGHEMSKAIKNVDGTADYNTNTVVEFYGEGSCNPIFIGNAGGNSMDWFYHGAGKLSKDNSLVIIRVKA